MSRRTRQELVEQLTLDARRIAAHFRLCYRAIEAERANVKSRYGICYSDGTIRIRLRHAVSGAPLKYSSLVNTLCHELAHLRHFNHGPRFKVFYLQILEWARSEGIYRPRSPREARSGYDRQGDLMAPAQPAARAAPPRQGPEQLDLFAWE